MRYSKFSDEKWLQLLLASVDSRFVEGITFPSFPSPETQARFVGSAYKPALMEAYNFYKLLKEHQIIQDNFKALDFGCGWGRFLRFLAKDFHDENLFGVDVDPDILEVCASTGVPGQLSHISPRGALPFPDGSLDSVLAYSVLTHLPEEIHLHWMNEIARVTKPGAVFCLTLESPRFLDFIEGLKGKEQESAWHAALARHADNVPESRAALSHGEIVYFPTGGGEHRGSDIYGDAVVPLKYVEKNWQDFSIIEYIDDPSRFWQAALVLRRN